MATKKEVNNNAESPTSADQDTTSNSSAVSDASAVSLERCRRRREALAAAVAAFDVAAARAALEPDGEDDVIKVKDGHLLLHDMTLSYMSYSQIERPAKLNIRYIELLTLLQRGAGVDVDAAGGGGRTALHMLAAGRGHSDLIKVLVTSGADVNARDRLLQTPLHLSTRSGSRRDVEALLMCGADPNATDATGAAPLHLAAKKRNNTETLELLLQYGAHVNLQVISRALHGPAPLHVAARTGCARNLSLLLRAGANPNAVGSSGATPLHVAASSDVTGHVTGRLLHAQADVNARDLVLQETALHKAVSLGMVESALALLRHPAMRVDLQDCHGDTALHRAAAAGTAHLGLLTALMRRGALAGRKNLAGQSPLDRAVRNKNVTALDVMRQFEEVTRSGPAPPPSPGGDHSVRRLPAAIMAGMMSQTY